MRLQEGSPYRASEGDGCYAQVRGDPGTVLKLRCLFLKLRSLLEVPLLRVGQARSPALVPTSRVYSSALVAFSCRLLQARLPPRAAELT